MSLISEIPRYSFYYLSYFICVGLRDSFRLAIKDEREFISELDLGL